jgi:hypothetical protein
MNAPTARRRFTSAEGKILRQFIAHRRRQEAAARAADSLEPAVMAILRDKGPVEASGATLALEQFFRWTYSPAVSRLTAQLEALRARERRDGTARAVMLHAVSVTGVGAAGL